MNSDPLGLSKKKIEPTQESPKPADNILEKKVTPAKEAEAPTPERAQNIIVHSELDAMLLDRVKSQPRSLDEIDAEVIVKPKEGRHNLSLPDELEPFTKKYAFCWIFKRKQAIDEACDMLHYKLTNRTYFPELPDHLFSARGIIERGDNVLAFRPKKIDEDMRKIPGMESIERIKQRTTAHEGDPNFYIPKEEVDGDKKVVGV